MKALMMAGEAIAWVATRDESFARLHATSDWLSLHLRIIERRVDRERVYRSVSGAAAGISRKCADQRIVAYGVSGVRKEATGGRRQQIPFEDWYDVKIGEGTRGEFFAEPEWRSKTLVWWHDLAFRSEDILREFPTPTAGDDQSSEQETQTAAQVVTPPLDQMPAGTNTTSAVAKPRPPSPAAAERGYLKYVEDFKTAHRSRDEDIAYMQAEFPGITASAVRQLRQQFAPAEWSRRGRRRNGDG